MESLNETVLLLIVLLLPGGFAAWGFENRVERHGRRQRDWLLRIAGFSAVILAFGAWPVHWFARNHWDALKAGSSLPPWWLYLLLPLYMLVPLTIGWLVGTAVGVAREERPNQPWWRSSLHWTNLQQRTPTAWHHLFEQNPSGLVRCKLRSGRFVGGIFTQPASYASGDQIDVYISEAVHFGTNGNPQTDDDGFLVVQHWGILVKWEDIETLELRPADLRSRSRISAGGDHAHRTGT